MRKVKYCTAHDLLCPVCFSSAVGAALKAALGLTMFGRRDRGRDEGLHIFGD